MKKRFPAFIEKISHTLHDEHFKVKHRMDKKYFTRKRKLGFSEICLLILKCSKHALHTAIRTFLDEAGLDAVSYSKPAFCKARKKIKPSAFKELFQISAHFFYENGKIKTYNGYRIFAIDGSDFNLPNTPELIEAFGSEEFHWGSQIGTQVQAQVSCLYDVLNHITVDAYMEPYHVSERKLAIRHIESLAAKKTDNDILLMDRGYPSEELLLKLEECGFYYVMRSNKKEFFKEIREVTADDAVVVRKTKTKDLRIRVITVQLDNGTEETLLTNLMDQGIGIEDFKYIYSLRWGIETKYNDLKNKLEIENFSSISPICIMQDFYATLFLSNAVAYLEADNEKMLEKINASEQNLYQYKVNISNAVSVLKESVVELVLTESKRKRKRILNKIYRELNQCLTPERRNRSFKRKRKCSCLRFPTNRKSC